MDKFFNRPPGVVAEELIGLPLRVGNKRVIIAKTLARGQENNEQWTDRPLFHPDAEAYVASYRGSNLLFFRTGPLACNTCVRIDGALTRDLELRGPGQVCRELGLVGEQVGRASLVDGAVTIEWIDDQEAI